MSEYGPQNQTIPQHSYKTCNGCGYFESKGVVFGHNFREDMTLCKHPEVEKDHWMFSKVAGKIIEHRTRTHENKVPHWCPFLKKEK